MGVKQTVLSAQTMKSATVEKVLTALANGNEEAKKSDKSKSNKK